MLGRHGVLVGELESLVARHPLRERLWAALMLALYRSGRQADAVRAYQRARDVLVGELGLEPGAELRRLEAGRARRRPDPGCARGERSRDVVDPRVGLRDPAPEPGRGGLVDGVRGAGIRSATPCRMP